jgi:plasmid stability protein
MPTLTIRNVPQHFIRFLKELASRNGRTVGQEAREILENHFGEQPSVLDKIEAS